LLPCAACAQVGVVDHNWCLQTARGRYGALQVTCPGPVTRNNTYTYVCLGKAEYRIHAPIPLLSAAVFVPLATAGLVAIRGLSGKGNGPNTDSSTRRVADSSRGS